LHLPRYVVRPISGKTVIVDLYLGLHEQRLCRPSQNVRSGRKNGNSDCRPGTRLGHVVSGHTWDIGCGLGGFADPIDTELVGTAAETVDAESWAVPNFAACAVAETYCTLACHTAAPVRILVVDTGDYNPFCFQIH